VINDKYGYGVDVAMFDWSQFYFILAAGAVFFGLLFAFNLRKPRSERP